MSRIDATTQAVLIQAIFFALSIGGAWVVLVLLKGTAKIRHKGAQFGGAAAMFVTMFLLLNRYVPEMRDGIIAEANAAQGQKVVSKNDRGSTEILDVFLTPSRQKITSRDLQDLDKNKYIVDDKLGIAVLRSAADNWLVQSGEMFDQINLMDLPFFKMSAGALLVGGDDLKNLGIFSVRNSKIHEVMFERSSEISGVQVGTNPFSNEEFLRKSLTTQLESAEKMGMAPAGISKEETKQALDLMLAMVGSTMKSNFDDFIEKSVPFKKSVQAGVYITLFELSDVPPDPFFANFSKDMSALDRALNALALKGLMAGNGRNLKVDQQARTASFDGSTRIRGVLIGGSKTDVTVNDIGFIIVGNRRIAFVQLLSLDIDGPSVLLRLKNIMDSLLFVT